jgi:hypothetical protein
LGSGAWYCLRSRRVTSLRCRTLAHIIENIRPPCMWATGLESARFGESEGILPVDVSTVDGTQLASRLYVNVSRKHVQTHVNQYREAARYPVASSGDCSRTGRERTLHDLGGSVNGILGGFLQMVSAFEVRKNLPRH